MAVQNLNRRIDWNKWLYEQAHKNDPTPFTQYQEECIKAAKYVAEKYGMDKAEVMISDESVHANFVKGSRLYLNIIPRSLIIRTCKVTEHIETAVRRQLYRTKKEKLGEMKTGWSRPRFT